MHLIPHVLMLIAVTIAPVAAACDAAQLPLSGSVAVPSCVTQAPTDTCVFAGKALYDYIQAIPDDDSVLTIVLQSSPWRLYDAQMRILILDDLVASIQPKLGGGVQRVELIGSWTATAPTAGTASLAERLSQALDGFPVRGEDGFLWLAEDGTRRTTRQAFTVRASSGAYFIPKGADVLAALATGSKRSMDSAMEQLILRWEKDSLAAPKITTSSAPAASAPSNPFRFGVSTE